ncbi:LysR family transcriptional regulator [Bradyrhizobium sp. LTSP849]|uniref:LysR substrate-binding domain-containing protein n=1 Tax=unclassified Bradyrhizobium TaxID=2631580 RepID=UPI0005D2116A|nr:MULTISPECIES: LysR substrate-binding domain-containing protein [unclassified Bradyrhizobium]KJC50661.1 LysR family transcriptional regulator [Bradyrhizobium sp. LTSP849]KJC53140.1 LysR family transcriptional regulator [Bradyrhizobium sp. LTSP857]
MTKERELPLIALRAFAVAARAHSLSSAAKELGVTHGAVSKQIRALESWLGQHVFTREGRGLTLTPYGKILAEQLGQSFKDIGSACEYVRRQRSKTVLAIEAPSTFAMYFLMPRLKRFEARYDNVSVWISTRMTGETPDISANDLVITRGIAERIGSYLKNTTTLFAENLTPISAEVLLQRRPLKKPADILRHSLITSATRPGHWEAWLQEAGVRDYLLEGGHRFDHMFVAIHAVREGLGSIVAPKEFFVGPSRWKLRCPFPDIVVKGEQYFAHSTSRADPRHVNRFVDWMKEEIGK